MDEITQEKFNAYLEVQHGGETNMFDTKAVEALSGGELNHADIMSIMANYYKLMEKYGDIR